MKFSNRMKTSPVLLVVAAVVLYASFQIATYVFNVVAHFAN